MDNRHTADSNDAWRAAVRSGWNTERTNMYQVMEHIKGFDLVRYYGNSLHWAQLESHNKLPIGICSPNPYFLTQLEEFTKRDITLSTYKKHLVVPNETSIFIKPVREKWFEAKVYKRGELIQGSPNDDDLIYYSTPVKFVDEVRCFCLGGLIYTSSLYRINSIVWDATNEEPEKINFDSRIDSTPIPEMVKSITKKCNFDCGIVMDFGTNEAGEWSLVEFNEPPFCGLYYTDYDKALEVIINSQINIK